MERSRDWSCRNSGSKGDSMKIEYEFDGSESRIENGFEELLFALGAKEQEAEDQIYRSVAEVLSEHSDTDYSPAEVRELRERSYPEFNEVYAMYAQNLGELLKQEDGLRDEFYDMSVEERTEYLQLGRWVDNPSLYERLLGWLSEAFKP